MTGGVFSNTIGVPENAISPFRREEIDPSNPVYQNLTDPTISVDNTAWGHIAADGTINVGVGLASATVVSDGMCEVTLSVVPTTSGGKWRYNAVATPTTSAEGANTDGTVTFKPFSDSSWVKSDTPSASLPTKLLYSSLYDTFYVLGEGDDLVFKHPRLEMTQAAPETIDPLDVIRTPSEGSGCMSREGKFIWLSGYTTPYGVRAIDLSDDSVTDFGTTGDLVAVAAYEDAGTQYVLLYNAATSYVELYEADFGTPSLGSYVRRWNFNAVNAESKVGVWDNNDYVWFSPQTSMKRVNPLVDTTYYEETYPTSYSRCTPAYDSTRHRFYVRIGTGVDAYIYTITGWTDEQSNSGGWAQYLSTFEASAMYHDPTSDILYATSDVLKKGHRYVAATGEVLDCIKIENTTNWHVNADLNNYDDVFYKDDCAYFLGAAYWQCLFRAKYRGTALQYVAWEGQDSDGLSSNNNASYDSVRDEVWVIDNRYNDTGSYWESAWSVIDATTGTRTDHVAFPTAGVLNGNASVSSAAFMAPEWDYIVAHTGYSGGDMVPFAWKLSDRTEVGNWYDYLTGFTYGAQLLVLDTTNGRAFLQDRVGGTTVKIWSLDGTTHLPDAQISSHTLTSGVLNDRGHMDANDNFWVRTSNHDWEKVNPSGVTRYSMGADQQNNNYYNSCYDSLRDCIYYWSSEAAERLKKINCSDGTISTVADFPINGAYTRVHGSPMEYIASLDRIVAADGGVASDMQFAVWVIDPTDGSYDMIGITDFGGAHLFSPNVCYDTTRGAIWSYDTGGAPIPNGRGTVRVLVDDLLTGVGYAAEDLGQIFTCQTRKLSATKVRVDTILLGPPHIRKSAPFSLTVKYT